jgi:hypothetical protein
MNSSSSNNNNGKGGNEDLRNDYKRPKYINII